MPDARPRLRGGAEIAAISFAAILLEIAYTRVFSFKLPYSFTFLVLGIGLLGTGSGGVLLAIWPGHRSWPFARLVAACALLAGASALASYFIIAPAHVSTMRVAENPRDLARLLIVCGALYVPFLGAGTAIAYILGSDPERAGRLYAADLCGAALACAAVVPVLLWLTPPGTIALASAIFLLAAIAAARSEGGWIAGAAIALLLPAFGALFFHRHLPEPSVDEAKALGFFNPRRDKTLFTEWHPVYRVDVVEGGDRRVIIHDGGVASALHPFDGNAAGLTLFDTNSRSYPFQVLPPNPRVLIIGAAGGEEILASLHFGARQVTGVELNPVTVSLHTKHFADYDGHLATQPNVRLLNDDGRSFLGRTDERFDLVWFVAPDSYASTSAASASAFVLAESYLYTAESIEQSLASVGDDGIVCAQFGDFRYDRKPNRTARYVATARLAFERLGIPDFDRHVLVVTSPEFTGVSTVLLKKTPFTTEEIQRFLRHARSLKGQMARYAPGEKLGVGPVNELITMPASELDAWFAKHPYDLRPVTDDAPFFWHFARFRSALGDTSLRSEWYDDEDAIGERVLLVLLGISALFAGVALLLPLLLMRRTWGRIPFKGRAALYFASLGLGFMFLEVSLMQKLVLFLGFPTYSLTVTLFALLVFSGLGSLASERYGASPARALPQLVATLAAVVALWIFVLPHATDLLLAAPLPARIAVAVALIAPLGLCLGAFMPIGLRTVSHFTEEREAFVTWGWAVNGFFSVISSILATILAMTYGFNAVMAMALGLYAVGVAALLSTRRT